VPVEETASDAVKNANMFFGGPLDLLRDGYELECLVEWRSVSGKEKVNKIYWAAS
jgi:hypothetical protein